MGEAEKLVWAGQFVGLYRNTAVIKGQNHSDGKIISSNMSSWTEFYIEDLLACAKIWYYPLKTGN